MKIVVSYRDAIQIGPEDYKMVRKSHIFDSSDSIDHVMEVMKIKDLGILDFSQAHEQETK